SIHKLDFPAAVRPHEVVGDGFVVVQEVIFDTAALIAQAKDKVFMPKVRIVLHYMPQDRPRADRHHRLGYIVRIPPQTHTCSSTKQNHFHLSPPSRQVFSTP